MNISAQADSRDRQARLYLQHPDESPDLVGVLPYLIHPPSRLSSSRAWECFRDSTLLPMIRHRPDDPNLSNFLKQVESILAWRAGISPEDRFWKADEAGPSVLMPRRAEMPEECAKENS
jgi:hypothetical protein